MKRFSILPLAAAILALTSCDTTKEISLNKDGSGTIATTMDMSGLISMAKAMGQDKDLDSSMKEKVDTSIDMSSMADKLTDLSTEEKQLIQKGTLGLKIDMASEQFATKTSLPFENTGQLSAADKLSTKMIQQALKKQMGGEGAAKELGGEQMPEGSVDDYFVTTYSKGVIERKLNKAKYDSIASDKGMQAMKQMGEQGLPLNTTLIINLPAAAKKTTGKALVLSDDKMKATVKGSMEEFFDDPTQLEFRIEY